VRSRLDSMYSSSPQPSPPASLGGEGEDLLSGLAFEALEMNRRLFVAQFRSPDSDVVDFAGVVEGAEADETGSEGFVGGGHDGEGHVVVEDFDGTVAGFAFETDFVPDVLTPFDAASRCGGDIGARSVVHEEDVVGVGISFGSHMDVIEVRRILEAEEQAHVAMAVFIAGLEKVRFEDEIGEDFLFEKGDVEGRTDRRVVFALGGEFE